MDQWMDRPTDGWTDGQTDKVDKNTKDIHRKKTYVLLYVDLI